MSAPTLSFYFDLASPLAYMTAERVLHSLPVIPEWQPVLARELGGAESFDGYRCEQERDIFRSGLEHQALGLGLQPLRWPEPFPFDSRLAMSVATYAKGIGRVVPFAQAAFRQAFAGGHSLEQLDFVLIAAAACEMHPNAVKKGAHLRSVGEELQARTARARSLGITDVPAILVGEEPFVGESALEQAAAHLKSMPAFAGQGR